MTRIYSVILKLKGSGSANIASSHNVDALNKLKVKRMLEGFGKDTACEVSTVRCKCTHSRTVLTTVVRVRARRKLRPSAHATARFNQKSQNTREEAGALHLSLFPFVLMLVPLSQFYQS